MGIKVQLVSDFLLLLMLLLYHLFFYRYLFPYCVSLFR